MKRITLLLLIILSSFWLYGCDQKKNEFLVVPHSINQQIYSENAQVIIPFVSNYDIGNIEYVDLEINYQKQSSIENYEFVSFEKELTYQGYDIYYLTLNIIGLQGELYIDQAILRGNELYYFDLDITLFEYIEHDVTIYTSTGEANYVFPKYITDGITFDLQVDEEITINQISLISGKRFNISLFINQYSINENTWITHQKVEGKFSLNISFKDDTPNDYLVISQLSFKYLDSNANYQEDTVLIPLFLGTYDSRSKNFIDTLIS